MSQSLSTIERALQLARSGSYRSIDEIRRKLTAEQHDAVSQHLSGSLAKQLRAEIAKHKPVK